MYSFNNRFFDRLSAFLCGKIGYRRFLVRGCYNYHKKSCSQARWNNVKTFSDGCVSKAAFLCGEIGYIRFLVRGCYNYHKKSCHQARWNNVRTFSDGCVSKAAFLCGKIGYRRFLVRGCYCVSKNVLSHCVAKPHFYAAQLVEKVLYLMYFCYIF